MIRQSLPAAARLGRDTSPWLWWLIWCAIEAGRKRGNSQPSMPQKGRKFSGAVEERSE